MWKPGIVPPKTERHCLYCADAAADATVEPARGQVTAARQKFTDRAAGWIAGMVSMMADLVGAAAAQPGTMGEPRGTPGEHWSLLTRLENAAIGVRRADGSTRVRRNEPAGCILYGPYLHLPRGTYRLS